jgi:hypothetical protein
MNRGKWASALLLIAVLLITWGSPPQTPSSVATKAMTTAIVKATLQSATAPDAVSASAPETVQAEEAATDDGASDPSYGLVTEAPGDIRICANLGRPTRHKAVAENFAADAWRDDERTDPVAEAIRAPYKTLFQDPLLRNYGKRKGDLWPRIEDLPAEEKIARLKAEGFYDQSKALVVNLYPRMQQFNLLLRRSHHLAVLARVASLRPQAVAELAPYCQRVEQSLLAREKADVWGERKALIRLMHQVGVEPAEVGFDPNLYPSFDYGWYWDVGTWIQVHYEQGVPVKSKQGES